MYTKEERQEIMRLCTIPADKLTWEEAQKLRAFMSKYPDVLDRILDTLSTENMEFYGVGEHASLFDDWGRQSQDGL